MDVRANVTDTIIRMLEQGVTGEGSLWDGAGACGLPKNFKTGAAYSGINIPLLWMAARERKLTRNEWLTFNQAKDLGASVRKGAKGVMGVFFSRVQKKGESQDPEQGATVPMLKAFWLFNVVDIDGLELPPAVERSTFEPMEDAESLLAASGANICWGGTQAYYIPAIDEIRLPDRERFGRPVNAYAVALHELSHWTGHRSRLNRDFSGRFGSEAYAFEELVAELGSAFLVARLGLVGARMENHASYVQSWLKILKNDKTAIFTASKHAHAAYQHILHTAGLEQVSQSEE